MAEEMKGDKIKMIEIKKHSRYMEMEQIISG